MKILYKTNFLPKIFTQKISLKINKKKKQKNYISD
jgi:hypothetical protein